MKKPRQTKVHENIREQGTSKLKISGSFYIKKGKPFTGRTAQDEGNGALDRDAGGLKKNLDTRINRLRENSF